jgi:hypothetical protein
LHRKIGSPDQDQAQRHPQGLALGLVGVGHVRGTRFR